MLAQLFSKSFNKICSRLILSSFMILVPGGIALIQLARRVKFRRRFHMYRSCLAYMVLIILTIITTSTGCSRMDSQEAVAANISTAEIKESVPVKIQSLIRQDHIHYLSLTGSFAAHDEITVSSRVEGIIEEVAFEQGDSVKKGQLLLKIDDEEASLRVRQAEVELALARQNLNKMESLTRPEELDSAKAALEGALAQLKNARSNFDRTRALFERGMVSRVNMDRDQTVLETARAKKKSAQKALELVEIGARKEDIDISREQVKKAQINLALAELELERHFIYSPIDAEVTGRPIDRGEIIHRGSPAANLIGINPVKVKIQISERDISHFRIGDSVEISCGAYPKDLFQGKISLISSKADEKSRSFPVEVEIPNPQKKLKPGMVARARLVLKKFPQVFKIPWESVIEKDKQASVFLASEGKAVSRKINIVYRQDGWALVDQGLDEGNRLVIAGQERLKEGDEINILSEPLCSNQQKTAIY